MKTDNFNHFLFLRSIYGLKMGKTDKALLMYCRRYYKKNLINLFSFNQ